MKYETDRCAIQNLLLDPNNYRFLDLEDYQAVSKKRYHEATAQDKAYRFLKGKRYEDLQALKESISTNGYVPLELLIVRPYDNKKGGVKVREELIESFDALHIVIIDTNNTPK